MRCHADRARSKSNEVIIGIRAVLVVWCPHTRRAPLIKINLPPLIHPMAGLLNDHSQAGSVFLARSLALHSLNAPKNTLLL